MLSRIAKYVLILAGSINLVLALMVVGLVFRMDPALYLYLGTGETLVNMARAGSQTPAMLAGVLAIILFIWSAFAFSGAGVLRKLPSLRLALLAIAALYGLRGAMPIWLLSPENAALDPFGVWGGGFFLTMALLHFFGVVFAWEDIYYRPKAW